LTNITDVFSRSFIYGFFLPAYIGLVAVWAFASREFIPDSLEAHSQATQLLILGGVALVIGMVLSGTSYYVARFFEGYPLARVAKWLGWKCPAAVLWLQNRKYQRLCDVRDDKEKSPIERGRAAARLDSRFPKDRSELLPTRVGNAIRAFEQHSNVRWGLDGFTVWPRIEALLSGDERQLVDDARTNLYVFLNGALAAFFAGVCLAVDKAMNGTSWDWALYALPFFFVSYFLYIGAISPAVDWGDTVRASIDLHRLDLYRKLGVRPPTSFSDERLLAMSVNKALLFGHPLLKDELWDGENAAVVQERKAGRLASLKSFVKGGV